MKHKFNNTDFSRAFQELSKKYNGAPNLNEITSLESSIQSHLEQIHFLSHRVSDKFLKQLSSIAKTNGKLKSKVSELNAFSTILETELAKLQASTTKETEAKIVSSEILSKESKKLSGEDYVTSKSAITCKNKILSDLDDLSVRLDNIALRAKTIETYRFFIEHVNLCKVGIALKSDRKEKIDLVTNYFKYFKELLDREESLKVKTYGKNAIKNMIANHEFGKSMEPIYCNIIDTDFSYDSHIKIVGSIIEHEINESIHS